MCFLRHQVKQEKERKKKEEMGGQTDEAGDQLTKVEVGNLLVDANVGSCKVSVPKSLVIAHHTRRARGKGVKSKWAH